VEGGHVMHAYLSEGVGLVFGTVMGNRECLGIAKQSASVESKEQDITLGTDSHTVRKKNSCRKKC